MKSNQEIAYFIARMGHEIRTPINAIKGFGDILLTESIGSLNEKQRQYLKKMIKSSDQLIEVINQILDWAKLESGQNTLNLEKINIYSLVLEVISLFEVQAKNKNISLNVDGEKNTIIMGDPTKLRQVLINLTNNSLKFTPEEGYINIGFYEDDSKITIYVKDDGEGIPEDKISQIFDPFDQGPQFNVEEKGYGLGLWICKSIVDLHGGHIRAESKVNGGTSIFIDLPQKIQKQFEENF